MGQKSKVLVTDEARFDLSAYEWDDHRFSDILISNNPINTDQALDISRFLREEINRMDNYIITMPVIEKLIENKLLEFGLAKPAPVRLDKSMFVKNGLVLSESARCVLERRYLKKNDEDKAVETATQMFLRVARHIAKAEDNYGDGAVRQEMEKRFFKMMSEFKFLPNSPTLMNAGRELGQLAACFVLPVEDSMEGIFETLKNAALIHKSGGGTGFSFSRLRPKDSRVGTTGGVASGPVSFMRVFNTATEQVKQGGTRRGANIAILRADHPDIMEFIFSKSKPGELNNFNISVGMTAAFMEAVKKSTTYDLTDPNTQEKKGALNAREVYQGLVEQAWKNGDPGIVFLDRLNRDNPTPELGEIETTNPCGEQPLLPGEACTLGSINLVKFVVADKDEPTIDFDGLRDVIHCAVRFLDNTIDISEYPIPEIKRMVRGNRKIGLGLMGFADMLYRLEIPYNSDEALEIAEKMMRFIQNEARQASKALAAQRGVFDNFEKSVFKNREECTYRNATTTTIAPTGTLSIIADCSSGIEPLFALSFIRNVMDNDKLRQVNPCFEKVARERGFYSDQLMDTIARKGSIQDISIIPKDVRRIFVTAHDVSPEWHIRMQAAFQKYTDNAVSKTVNMRHDATVEDVLKVYNMAYELGCKGVTIYRDGSKTNQVLSYGDKPLADNPFQTAVKERPEVLEGFTSRISTGMGQLYVTVTELEGQPFEVFATIGKSGRSTTAKTEAIGRLISLALRAGVKVDKIIDQLKGIGGEYPVFRQDGMVLSIPDAISRVLEKKYSNNTIKNGSAKVEKSLNRAVCPECKQAISFEEGCLTCHFCGFSKCG